MNCTGLLVLSLAGGLLACGGTEVSAEGGTGDAPTIQDAAVDRTVADRGASGDSATGDGDSASPEDSCTPLDAGTGPGSEGGAFTTCDPYPCETNQFCVHMLPGESGMKEYAFCKALPSMCALTTCQPVPTCVCVEAWGKPCGLPMCAADGGEITVTCDIPAPP
jgi:hypothetical protein